MRGGVLTMLRAYHVTIHLPDGQRRVQADLCLDSATAADHAAALYPSAQRLDVHRLVTVLTGGVARGATPEHAGRAA